MEPRTLITRFHQAAKAFRNPLFVPIKVELIFLLFFVRIIHLIKKGQYTESKHNINENIKTPRKLRQA